MSQSLFKALLLLPCALFIQACNSSNTQSIVSPSHNNLFASEQVEKATTQCSATKLKEILAPASAGRTTVRVDCNVQLSSTDVVTKVLDFYGPSASGVTFDCGGGVIDGQKYRSLRTSKKAFEMEIIAIRPEKGTNGSWQRPENITVRNCEIRGSVRVWWGNERVAMGDEIVTSSRTAGHTAFMQSKAPRSLHFIKNTFKSDDMGNIIYFGPGVTDSSVVDSKFTGNLRGGAIYFEAEAARNLVKGNVFEAVSEKREVISVDASSHNIIINNTFRQLKMGGIFLYRNCGEKAVIRHTSPDKNIIVNNVFDYSKAAGEKYGIFVSSRTGGAGYCKDDDGYPYGSSKDDGSPARNNVIGQNRVINQTVAQTIKIAYESNFERENEKVSSAPARKAGCFISAGSPSDFVSHGGSVSVFMVNGVKTCKGIKVTCNDGVTSQSTISCSPIVTPVPTVTPTVQPTVTPTPTPSPSTSKNVCYIDLNDNNRLVVRNKDGSGIAYFDASQGAQAQAKLTELKNNKTCDTSSKSTLPAIPPECVIELNNANRLVIRNKASGAGLAYFASTEKKQAEAKLKELKAAKACR